MDSITDMFWDIYFANELAGVVIAVTIGAAVVYLFVLILRLFAKEDKEPMSEEMKEFLENAEWKDVTMPNGDVVSMPYKKEWEKETLAYELLRKRELEEE